MSALPSKAAVRKYTIKEYLDSEYTSPVKREYHNGVIVEVGEMIAMAGGAPEHSLVIANLIGSLYSELQGKPCRAYDSNLRVRPAGDPSYYYPDCSVVCGPLEFEAGDDRRQTVINPIAVFEVISPSSEAFDRGEKFAKYRQIASLRHYIVISLSSPMIDIYTRKSDGTWLFSAAHGLDGVMKLDAIDVSVPLRQVYSEVTFDSDSAAPAG